MSATVPDTQIPLSASEGTKSLVVKVRVGSW